MLTPQDIQNKEFVKAVFGGYDMAAVDDFLEDITEDYSSLYKENAILKNKMKVLVDKIEEYRSTEDAMRMALLTAQRMGDDLLADAKAKSEAMIAEAQEKSDSMLASIDAQTKDQEARLTEARALTAKFIADSRALIEEQDGILARLNALEGVAQPEEEEAEAEEEAAPAEEVEEAPAEEEAEESSDEEIKEPENTEREINAFVSKMMEDTAAEAEAEEEAVADGEPTKVYSGKKDWLDEDDESTSPRPKFDFEDLKFGRNYQDK